jgi:hypothetical protein
MRLPGETKAANASLQSIRMRLKNIGKRSIAALFDINGAMKPAVLKFCNDRGGVRKGNLAKGFTHGF